VQAALLSAAYCCQGVVILAVLFIIMPQHVDAPAQILGAVEICRPAGRKASTPMQCSTIEMLQDI